MNVIRSVAVAGCVLGCSSRHRSSTGLIEGRETSVGNRRTGQPATAAGYRGTRRTARITLQAYVSKKSDSFDIAGTSDGTVRGTRPETSLPCEEPVFEITGLRCSVGGRPIRRQVALTRFPMMAEIACPVAPVRDRSGDGSVRSRSDDWVPDRPRIVRRTDRSSTRSRSRCSADSASIRVLGDPAGAPSDGFVPRNLS